MCSGRRSVSSESYKPGDVVPFSGIYRIEHAPHRMMHHATLTEGMLFPRCKKCGEAVRFAAVRHARGVVLPFRETEVLEDFPDSSVMVVAGN